MSEPKPPVRQLAEAVLWQAFPHVEMRFTCRCPNCGKQADLRIGGGVEAPWGVGLFNCGHCGASSRIEVAK